MANNNKKSMAALAILVIVLLWLCSNSSSSPYILTPAPVNGGGGGGGPPSAPPLNGVGVVGIDVDAPEQYAQADLANTNINLNLGCAMNSGVGLASSLLPREVASQENFGDFAPNDILKGQNLLDPKQQIGIPESIGGALRNGNQSIRADPPNPKQAYEWNNSTIVPDLMRRSLC
jgi:hypothetical protein